MRAATPIRTGIAIALACLLALAAPACSGSGKKKAARKRTVLMTSSDDEVVGQQAAADVKAQIGVLENSELVVYVDRVGRRVLRGMPRRAFGFEFNVVDQMEPNAFALPGGYVFISRGLLALANSEDELACVIGHEIIHSAHRHAAQQQALSNAIGFSMPWTRAGKVAGYSRDMEREADRDGQKLCAAAGYDPEAMSTFLASLDQRERLIVGYARNPTFLDTHPGSRERVTTNAMRAREIRWQRDPSLGDTRASHLKEIAGMVLGDRPETGIFDGNRFVHPELGFELRFPKDWNYQNSAGAVGAISPRRDSMVYLEGGAGSSAEEAADIFTSRTASDSGMSLTHKRRVKLGDIDAVRYEYEGRGGAAYVTFFPFDGGVWRIVGVGAISGSRALMGNTIATARSFRLLSDEERERAFEVDILEVVWADPGEDPAELNRRTGNLWDPASTALVNGLLPGVVFDGGERLKIKHKGRAGANTSKPRI
jgi:predicted Zn-dependent protease